MNIEEFLNNGRREGIFKICLNLCSILFAAMLASEFFLKFTLSIRVVLGLALIALILVGVLSCPPREEKRSE